MKIATFPRLIQLLALTTATSTCVAIILVGMCSVEPVGRTMSPPTFQVISNAYTTAYGHGLRLLDFESGRLEPLSLPPGKAVDWASISPWEDRGHRQIIAVGWDRFEEGGGGQRADVSMVRMSLPEGKILNQVPLAKYALPASPLCWIPGATAGVLYAGLDGQIHRLDFESSRADGRVADVQQPRPRLLTWQIPGSEVDGARVNDLAWPSDERLGGRMLASLRLKDRATGNFGDLQLWWLQTDREGKSIVAAGRLLEPAPGDDVRNRRLPNLVGSSGGRTALAYFAKVAGYPDYQLRVSPLRFNDDSGIPHASEAESHVVATGCLLVPAASSANGQWLTALRRNGQTLSTVRIALPPEAQPAADQAKTERIAVR